MFYEKIRNKEARILTYGMTPPKKNNTEERLLEIAEIQQRRISQMEIDGLILYDIQDEGVRETNQRPMPFIETVDPLLYYNDYLKEIKVSPIIYRCVGKYTQTEVERWLEENSQNNLNTVFVGASSKEQKVAISLTQAYDVCDKYKKYINLGGVIIPERHMKYGDEHLRVMHKKAKGCSFFVTQAIYNLEASKNFLSDYYYYCMENDQKMVPILLNLTPCGSLKTLEFMKWLGVSIPKWLENELVHSEDILAQSVAMSKSIFEELFEFGMSKGIPIGCSVESISTRKVEIEASVELTKEIKQCMNEKNTFYFGQSIL